MILFYMTLACNILQVSGVPLSEKIYQTPTEMYKRPGEMAILSCSHSIQTYNQILWYKSAPSGHLQLLGHIVESSVFKEDNVSVEIYGNAETNEVSTFLVGLLSSDSSAVYFCAASRLKTLPAS